MRERSTWGTQPGSGREPEYSRHRFYIHSTNKHNHSSTMRTQNLEDARAQRMPETTTFPLEVVAQIKAVVDDPRTDYRSVQDFFRDAAWHRLHDLEDIGLDSFHSYFFAMELASQDLLAYREANEAFQTRIDFFQESVDEAVAQNDPHAIADIVHLWRKHPPGLRHRRKWLETVGGWEKQQKQLMDEEKK